MYEDLKGRVALITGSGQGIGKGIAMALAAEGVDIAVNVRKSREVGEETVEEIRQMGLRAELYVVDVSHEDDVDTMVESVVKDFGRLDILVNNAGIPGKRGVRLDKIPRKDWRLVFDVNLHGTFYCCQAAMPHLSKQEGATIINIASTAAVKPLAYWGAYSTSKEAVAMLTKQMAFEFAEEGVRVNCVAPGQITTPRTAKLALDPALSAPRLRGIPLHRSGKPEEIGDAVAFLASNRSAFITGQVMRVDGGEAEYVPLMADRAKAALERELMAPD